MNEPFQPIFQVYVSLTIGLSPTPMYSHNLTCSYLPVHHLLVSSLTTIHGSFPRSNNVITSGLEMEGPVYKEKKIAHDIEENIAQFK